MYPLKKGKTANQAHVGLPEGTFEEEHGRKGFYGKSAHLYHAHPPTGWIRFEGKLRPHCFDLNELQPADLSDAEGMPVAFLGNSDVRLYVSRRSEPMPFYFRNADGDELYFVHRGEGKIETDFGPLDYEPGDYINIPARGHLPRDPRNARQFLPDHSIQVRIRAARQRTARPARALRSRHRDHARAGAAARRPRRMGDSHQSGRRDFQSGVSVQSHRRGGLEGRPHGLEDQHARHPPGDEPSRAFAAQRAHYFRHAGAVVCSFLPRPLEQDDQALRVPFFHRNTDYDEFIFYHDGDFFSKDNIKAGMATLHPRGIHHGPHPKALANQKNKTQTDEYAVMLDGLNPIHVLPAGEDVEWKDYWMSWMEQKPVETR